MWTFNPLNANPTKLDTLKQFVYKSRRIVWVCLTIFGRLALKRLTRFISMLLLNDFQYFADYRKRIKSIIFIMTCLINYFCQHYHFLRKAENFCRSYITKLILITRKYWKKFLATKETSFMLRYREKNKSWSWS